ncbi:MAG: cation-translocating P-type ATPase [Sarcina sp.]
MTSKKTEFEKKGLTKEEALERQKKFGKNKLIEEEEQGFFKKIIEVLKEPMFLLLMVSAIIYFVLGEPRDGAIMLIFVIVIIAIDVIQEWKTDKSLKALKELSAPQIKVIRAGNEELINSEDLVPGDLMIITEGVKIPADGRVITFNDLAVNESSLTGEAEAVWKNCEENLCNDYWRRDYCYAGTLVTQGYGIIEVEKIAIETEYGKIGKSIAEAKEEDTPMQKQTRKLVKICAIIALILFLLVGIITYFNLSNKEFFDRIVESILSGITLAMAMIPEEFPVVLTVFLSMGAFRLAKKKSLVRKLPSVETLGAISVLCVDKTGTITMNKMSVEEELQVSNKDNELIEIMGLACETEPYDPMEIGMLEYCEKNNLFRDDIFNGEFIKEYSFTNERKMMGHVWEKNNEIIVAAKGSPEKILNICELTKNEKENIEKKIFEMSKKGLRVIAIGKEIIKDRGEIPSCLEHCNLKLVGIVGLLDPPRENIDKDIEKAINAGIRVVMITGDNGVTASSIAKKVAMKNTDKILTGEELDNLSDEELKERIKEVNIFSRVIPEHKMRIVKAFKENGEVVAMTGDGVNDAAALKYADIGIAMGKRGSEVSREAADLILLDDNFSTIIETIKDGRRIYDNIRKSVGYIFTIHIPIAFASLMGPLLGINSSMLLLLPLHVVLLEVLIDPTCSIVLERQPAEDDIMSRKPRNPNEGMVNGKILMKSIMQGIIIFLASFGSYYFLLKINNQSVEIARSIGLTIIIFANLFLVQVNSSDTISAYKSLKKLKKDPVMWTIVVGTILGLAIILYTPIAKFLGLTSLGFREIGYSLIVAFIAVMWYEIVKFLKSKRVKR